MMKYPGEYCVKGVAVVSFEYVLVCVCVCMCVCG